MVRDYRPWPPQMNFTGTTIGQHTRKITYPHGPSAVAGQRVWPVLLCSDPTLGGGLTEHLNEYIMAVV